MRWLSQKYENDMIFICIYRFFKLQGLWYFLQLKGFELRWCWKRQCTFIYLFIIIFTIVASYNFILHTDEVVCFLRWFFVRFVLCMCRIVKLQTFCILLTNMNSPYLILSLSPGISFRWFYICNIFWFMYFVCVYGMKYLKLECA